MVRFWDIFKYIIGAFSLILILRVIFSDALFGSPGIGTIIGIGIFSAGFITWVVIKYYPLIKVARLKNSTVDFEKEVIHALINNNIPISADICDDNLISPPDCDISGSIGENGEDYFMRYKDPIFNVTRNIFYDGIKKKIRLELKGDVLNPRPKEAFKEAVIINAQLKTGTPVPKIVSTPGQIFERIVEKIPQTQPEAKA